MPVTAVLVDGGFYLRRAARLWGEASPAGRADELLGYARFHIAQGQDRLEGSQRSLYRIFYYDCPPLTGVSVWQPWNGANTTFDKSNPRNAWATEFHEELAARPKVAMRMGRLSAVGLRYVPREEALKRWASDPASFSPSREDFALTGLKQTGVDMKIGLDVAALAAGGRVGQIVLVAGDADFVPVAKAARRAGVDFIVDPMGNHVSRELVREVDDLEDLHRSYMAPAGGGGGGGEWDAATVH